MSPGPAGPADFCAPLPPSRDQPDDRFGPRLTAPQGAARGRRDIPRPRSWTAPGALTRRSAPCRRAYWTFGPRPPVIDPPPHEPSRIEPLGAQPRRVTQAPSRDREPRAARRRTYLSPRPDVQGPGRRGFVRLVTSQESPPDVPTPPPSWAPTDPFLAKFRVSSRRPRTRTACPLTCHTAQSSVAASSAAGRPRRAGIDRTRRVADRL